MNKKQFVREVAKESGLTQKDVAKMLKAFIRVVERTLKKGIIQIVKFGRFYPLATKEKIINNLYSGGAKVFPAGTAYKFKLGKSIKRGGVVNGRTIKRQRKTYRYCLEISK